MSSEIQLSLFEPVVPMPASTPAAALTLTAVPTSAAAPPRPKPARTKPSRIKCRSLIREVGAQLKALAIPYVAVDEAKKALFANAQLRAFHYAVYCRSGGNWLLWCGQPRQNTRQDMRQWAQVFGEGFSVVYALRRAGGIVYRSEQGQVLSLEDCLKDAVPATLARESA